jgi:hypothetical protein
MSQLWIIDGLAGCTSCVGTQDGDRMDLHRLEDARNVAVGCHTRPHKSGPGVGGILHMLTQ